MSQVSLFAEPAPYNGAILSPCGLFRYRLWRTVGPSPRRVLFGCLNPSTADALIDDATVRQMIGFAKLWGYGRFDVVNMFAFRATNPRDLLRAMDPVGPDNDNHIAAAAGEAETIVAAWGGSIPPRMTGRRDAMRRLFKARAVYCLNRTKDGEPRHVLYLPRSTPLEVLWNA